MKIINKEKLNNQLIHYTEKEIRNISSNKITIVHTIEDIKIFVVEELNKKASNKKIYLGKINNSLASKIQKLTGLDVSNYNISLKGDIVRKIIKSHGDPKTEDKRGQIAVTKEDFAYIDDILLNADSINKSYETNDGLPALIFKKQIFNKYTLVEFISKRNYTLEVQTMYIHKKGLSPSESYYRK